jgi:hypothetical protein
MAERETIWAQQYNCGHNRQDTSLIPSVLPLASPTPPQPTGGAAFPANAPQIFPLPQNSLTLAFNATKSQPRNPRVWKFLRRIFAMLTKERKDALREFSRLSGKIDKEIVIQPKVQGLQGDLTGKKKRQRKTTEKPPPNLNSAAWLYSVVPALRRAPSSAALRCVGGCVFFHAA